MIGIRDVEAAAERLSGVIVDTPLLSNAELDARAGGRVWLKPEMFQEIGSFKIRGAFNLMQQLSDDQAANGVVAWSSGNHAQGVALAGKLLGIRAAIVMPEDAPAAKLENTRRLGGEVITYDRYSDDREAIAGLEIAEQSLALGEPADQVLIPCSGGGLTAGCAIALTARLPGVRVHPVEPEHYDDTTRSLAGGERVCVGQAAPSICDSLLVGSPGQVNFEIMRELTAPGLVVTETEVREAMRFAFQQLKLVVEPGGAVGLAAVLAGKLDTRGRVTAVVLSGGNVDRELFAEIQAEPG